MRSLYRWPLRRTLVAGFWLAGALVASSSAQAQTPTSPPPSATTYRGPRFPGGPDSLQATLARWLRPVSPTLVGQVLVRLEVNSAGQTQKVVVLPPLSGTPAASLVRAAPVQALLQQVPERLPVWLLDSTRAAFGPPSSAAAPLTTSVLLPLTFGAHPTAALRYSDTTPVFPTQPGSRSPYGGYFLTDITFFLQRQIRYPPQDIRNRVQGTLYAYLEVSETGAVEQRRVVSGLSPTLNEEVERVLQLLPPTLTPPRQGGRPVRVSYVIPLNFRVQ
jgi:protein TonB